MTYTPSRNERFYYVWEAINFIEENQCRTCVFSKLNDPDENRSHAEEYPMCYPVEGEMIAEQPVECIDDRGDEGIVCTLYKNVEFAQQEHPSQGRLF